MSHTVSQSDMRLQRGAKARAEILRAAERIFAASGLEGARTEAIAEAARVNKALLFYHFKSKDALFRAVIDDYLGGFHRSAIDLLSSRASPKEILLQYLDLSFSAVCSRPHLSYLLQRAVLTDSRLTEQIARKYFVPRLYKLAALVQRGIKDGDFRHVDGLQMALSLNALIAFSFLGARAVKSLTGVYPLSERNLRKRKDAVLDFVRHGLFRDPEVIHHDS